MKTIATSLVLLSLAAPLPAQQSDRPAAGVSTSADDTASTPAPNAPAAATDNLANTGVVMKDGEAWLIQNNQARRLDAGQLPEGQMLNGSGQLVPLPANVSGFDASPSAPSAPSATSASAATADPATMGVTMRGGTLFLVNQGQARRLDTATLGSDLMMTLDGRNVPIPENVSFDAPEKSNSSANNEKRPPLGGISTPDNASSGPAEGADIKGGNTTGNKPSR